MVNMAGKAQKLVLCAEDNLDDAFFCQRSAKALGAEFDFRVVPDGPSVIGWLTGQGIYVNPQTFPLPHVVVLDIKLPCLTGFETLRWIRAQKQFETLPVIIHSSSSLREDLDMARELGATNYIVKDPHCTRLAHYLKLLDHEI
jgi:CheY-like chemotaxis protein